MSKAKSCPKIDILLPVKEKFSAAHAGAVATVVYDLVSASTQSSNLTVIGRSVTLPFPNINYVPLKPIKTWIFGKNIGFTAAYIDRLKHRQKPDLIEIHGRCNVAAYVLKKRPDIPIILYLHNDPRDMKGAKSVAERQRLLDGLVQIICVSNYIRNCFLDGLLKNPKLIDKIQVVQNGVVRRLKSPPAKERIIFIAGRMVAEKGILEAASALAEILPSYPEWRLVIAGSKKFKNSIAGKYELKVQEVISKLGNQALMTGFIPIENVRHWQERSAIAACPSLWQEPLGKVVIEALAAGCAVLTTRCGGIPEVAEGRAMIIDKPSVSTFRDGFQKLLKNETLRNDLQAKAWADFPFTNIKMAHKMDLIRLNAMVAFHQH